MSDTTQNPASASGRFVLRIDPQLHERLRAAAKAAGTSLNEYCASKLAAAPANLGDPAAARTVARAAEIVADDLIAVAVFGSWARDTMGESSDVDVLLVLDDAAAVTRELYRRWDEEPLAWRGHRVEPHFVTLPDNPRRVAGLWAEVAVDGIVLFDRGFRLSRRLGRLRRDIVAGRIVRREVHGQPYWVEAA